MFLETDRLVPTFHQPWPDVIEGAEHGDVEYALSAVIASTSAHGIWTLQVGVFPENAASIALHGAHGFRIVGIREHIARHRGRWRDMLLLERHHDGGDGRRARAHCLSGAI